MNTAFRLFCEFFGEKFGRTVQKEWGGLLFALNILMYAETVPMAHNKNIPPADLTGCVTGTLTCNGLLFPFNLIDITWLWVDKAVIVQLVILVKRHAAYRLIATVNLCTDLLPL